MERFWLRMTQLFQHKWTSTEGDCLDAGRHTDTFLRWCKELEHFTVEDWKRAYKRIEGDIKQAARIGDDLWPPCSLDVVTYAEPVIGSKMYKSFVEYDGKPKAIEDTTAREKRFAKGREECAKILGMWDD